MAQKFLTNNAGQITEAAAITASAGAASSGLLPALGAAGTLDSSFLPTGVGPDTQTITASEAIAAGALVNIWNNAGAFSVRNADCSAAGKEAHGFVLAAAAQGATATVYFNGNNTAAAGLSPGRQYLGVAGAISGAAPAGTGKIVQIVGAAPSATVLNFTTEPSILLA